ncbi:MAG: HPr family phosphocarrier protein [Lachnospiraceae bacterium]|nr:HPr family phosphocarrier protein [Lachnospiraceae bacterium]
MISKELVIHMKSGLEARPTAVLVQIACKYASSIYILKDNIRVNAKSIMGMMALTLVPGDRICLEVDGPDAVAAISEIEAYLGQE